MASRKFRFVSPGVFLREIDNSQLPRQSEAIGPIVIGRTRKGPGMKPYKVQSLEEFERVFGTPMPGNQGDDPWRDGTGILAEAYAPYAARAYLTSARNTDSPLTVVRLLGVTGDNANSDGGEPGWLVQGTHGLFLTKCSADALSSPLDLNLAAIFYSTTGSGGFKLQAKGTKVGTAGTVTEAGAPIKFDDNGKLTLTLSGSLHQKEVKFSFDNIRKEFNTNPVSTNTKISTPSPESNAGTYWLGETFEDTYNKLKAELTTGEKMVAVVLPMHSGMGDFKSTKYEMSSGRTGWVFGQDTTNNTGSFDGTQHQRLFRAIALHEGVDASKGLIVGIEDIKVPRPGATTRFGSFSVVVRKIGVSRLEIVERFDNCSLDPASSDFIAKKIGDQYYEWSPSEKRNKLYNSNPNVSEYIRIEMAPDIESSGGPRNNEHVPFGFYGPVVPADESTTLAIEGAVAETMVLKIETTVSAASLVGKKLTVTKCNTGANTSKEFEFKDDGSDGPLDINIQGAASNPQAILPIIRNKLIGTADLVDGITFTPSGNGGGLAETITMVQATGGEVTTITTDAAGTDLTLELSQDGVAGTLNTSPQLQAWADSVVNLTDTGLTEGDTIRAKWPESLPVNTASADQGFYQGLSPFTRTFSSDGGSTVNNKINRSYVDYVRKLPDHDSSSLVSSQTSGLAVSGKTKYSFVFSLDEVVLVPATRLSSVGQIAGKGDVKDCYFAPGSHTTTPPAAERSYTWNVANGATGVDIRTLLDVVDGFHMPLVGGFDGVDIREADPFNARILDGATTVDSYAYASVDRAIELIKDPEAVEHNLAVAPGITEPSLTTKLVDTCEARADSMAIIDLPNVYVPPFQEKCDNFQQRIPLTGNPESSARNLVNRQLNSSYGSTYYPWVKIKDEVNSRDVWVPPSVVALGVMGHTESSAELWFAPAGFNRGGLNSGNAGVPVLQVTEQLLSKDRDTLYAANINPIASFVSEGIVIFGQKTLQSTQSALDRINVRRLLIFVKKEISRISSTLLFEQNVQATWARFHKRAKTLLDSVKVRFGLTDYKVVLDTTTTTPDLIDRNIMYAKVFLKPARAIEFIAVDFVITNTGAEFND